MDEKIILTTLYNQIKKLLADVNRQDITAVYPNFSADSRGLAVVINAGSYQFAAEPVDCTYSDFELSREILDSMPDELYLALFENAIKSKLSDLEKSTDKSIQITDYISKDRIGEYTGGTLSFKLKDKDEITFRVHALNKASLEFARDLLPHAREDNDLPDLSTSVDIVIGTTRLGIDEIENLEVGDAVLIDRYFIHEMNIKFKTGKLEALADISPDFKTLTLKSSLKPISRSTNMTDDAISSDSVDSENTDNNSQSLNTEMTDINDLKFDVDYVLDQKNMTLSEIRELSEGAVIDINPLALNHIKLCINGQCIGTGKIIDAGDSLAIEILELSGKK
ncbi:MAG: FliM/FliN family flagellar motor switch protein [Succinivibrio sp.]